MQSQSGHQVTAIVRRHALLAQRWACLAKSIPEVLPEDDLPGSAHLRGEKGAQIVLVRVAVTPVVVSPLHVAPLCEDVCQILVLCNDLCMVPPASDTNAHRQARA